VTAGRPTPGPSGGLACLASAVAIGLSGCGSGGKPTTVVSSASAAPSQTGTVPRGTSTVNGAVVSTRYGDIEVAVTLTGGRVTDVKPILLPTDRPRSAEISQQAEPLLREESLQAQSGKIDIVSGATYTSEAWAQSLSAALAVR
jgi:uncharacterized protein with FMN-binding domain